MKLIFLGPPGVGKGTIAKMLSAEQNIPQISTGDLLRTEIKKNTELGTKAKELIDKGELVPDELVVDMVKKRLEEPDCNNGYILDGFPRTLGQAEAMEHHNIIIDKVINFTAGNEMIVQRLSGRRTCKQCGAIFHIENIPPKKEGMCDKCNGELFQRDDDKPESIKNRLIVYNSQTEPLIEHYEKKGLLVSIDGSKTPPMIFELTKEVL